MPQLPTIRPSHLRQPPTNHTCHLLPSSLRSWLENFAKAADEVGVPVCMSLAVVDMTTDEAVETRDFHATGPVPKSAKAPRGSSSPSGTKGSSTGTTSKPSGSSGSKGSAGGR